MRAFAPWSLAGAAYVALSILCWDARDIGIETLIYDRSFLFGPPTLLLYGGRAFDFYLAGTASFFIFLALGLTSTRRWASAALLCVALLPWLLCGSLTFAIPGL